MMKPQAIAKLLETSRHYFSLPLPAVAAPVAASERYRFPRKASPQGRSRRKRNVWNFAGRSEAWR
jgi:hypothetical protein